MNDVEEMGDTAIYEVSIGKGWNFWLTVITEDDPENVEADMVNCNDLSKAHAQVPHLDCGCHVTSLLEKGRTDREAATTAS